MEILKMKFSLKKAISILFFSIISFIALGEEKALQSTTDKKNECFYGKELVGIVDRKSAVVKVIPKNEMDIFVEYGTSKDKLINKSGIVKGEKERGVELPLKNLAEGQQYFYRISYKKTDSKNFMKGETYSFVMPRKKGESFSFTVQADSHRDEKTDENIYRQTLNNILKDKPDFHIDLGDTFMSEKFAKNAREVRDRYVEEREFFDIIGNTIPLYLVNGNHEGENGWRKNGKKAGDLGTWASLARLDYYFNPLPNSFYNGNSSEETGIGKRGGYYAFEWGDALFVVLDPFWHTIRKPKTDEENWNYTLGKTQYDWLKKTLEESKAKYKFVFSHNLVGGSGKEGRGGVEGAPYFEWGGLNLDGSEGFRKNRPGWEKPIHQLLADNRVDIFFHGHDHFYGKQELDGVVYQLVPQPGAFSRNNKTNLPGMYGYKNGKFLAPSGHMRVTINDGGAVVDYVKSDGKIEGSYTISK